METIRVQSNQASSGYHNHPQHQFATHTSSRAHTFFTNHLHQPLPPQQQPQPPQSQPTAIRHHPHEDFSQVTLTGHSCGAPHMDSVAGELTGSDFTITSNHHHHHHHHVQTNYWTHSGPPIKSPLQSNPMGYHHQHQLQQQQHHHHHQHQHMANRVHPEPFNSQHNHDCQSLGLWGGPQRQPHLYGGQCAMVAEDRQQEYFGYFDGGHELNEQPAREYANDHQHQAYLTALDNQMFENKRYAEFNAGPSQVAPNLNSANPTADSDHRYLTSISAGSTTYNNTLPSAEQSAAYLHNQAEESINPACQQQTIQPSQQSLLQQQPVQQLSSAAHDCWVQSQSTTLDINDRQHIHQSAGAIFLACDQQQQHPVAGGVDAFTSDGTPKLLPHYTPNKIANPWPKVDEGAGMIGGESTRKLLAIRPSQVGASRDNSKNISELRSKGPASSISSSTSTSTAAAAVTAVAAAAAAIQRTNQCGVCGRNYARPSTLKTHLRTHTNERPFKCNVCFKTFSQAANLTAHQRVHTGERPFSCPICGRQFSQSSSVITHLRTHSGERPYRCSMCSRTFSDSSTLTKHCRIHSGEKPYQCDYCPLNFSQSGNLSRHLKLHLLGGIQSSASSSSSSSSTGSSASVSGSSNSSTGGGSSSSSCLSSSSLSSSSPPHAPPCQSLHR